MEFEERDMYLKALEKKLDSLQTVREEQNKALEEATKQTQETKKKL